MPINILHLIDQHRIGGPGKTIINTAKHIDRERFTIHTASFVPVEQGTTELAARLQDEQIPYLALNDCRGVSRQNLQRLQDYARRYRIDVLHGHGYKSDFHGLLFKRQNPSIKVVTTHHGWIKNSLRQYCFVKIAQKLSGFFDGVIVVSRQLQRDLPGAARRSKTSHLIHNALVLEDYKAQGRRTTLRNHYNVGKDEFVLGVVGRLSVEKGCREIIDAFGRAAAQVPRARLMLIGEGPLQSELEARAASNGMASKIIFAGYQNPIQPFYEALDALVCPSHTEGLSNVIIEAFAFKLPVIATAVGGNPDIITSGWDGLLVPPKSIEALQAAIVRLVRGDADLAALGTHGHQRLLDAFTFDVRTRKAEAFYEQVVQNTN